MTLRGDLQTYIHAVFVNVCTPLGDTLLNFTNCIFVSQGYKQQRAFIIAQSPMESTARDFWKMVHDRKCGVIVMLCDLVEDKQVATLYIVIAIVYVIKSTGDMLPVLASDGTDSVCGLHSRSDGGKGHGGIHHAQNKCL